MACHTGPREEGPDLLRRQKEQGESMGRCLYSGLLGESKARQDMQV